MIIYKSNKYPDSVTCNKLIRSYIDWNNNGCNGGSPLEGYDELKKCVKFENNEFVVDFEFSEKTKAEIDKEKAETEELEKLQSDLDYFLDKKVRSLRDLKLYEWIDETFAKPLLYDLTETQVTERLEKREWLLELPATIEHYMTDDELQALFIDPSYIQGD